MKISQIIWIYQYKTPLRDENISSSFGKPQNNNKNKVNNPQLKYENSSDKIMPSLTHISTSFNSHNRTKIKVNIICAEPIDKSFAFHSMIHTTTAVKSRTIYDLLTFSSLYYDISKNRFRHMFLRFCLPYEPRG